MSTWARTVNGDLYLPSIGHGADAIETDPDQCCAIKLRDRLGFVKGEWFLDTNQGFPWQAIRGQKRPNVAAARLLLRRAILQTPPVVSVTDAAVFNRQLRDLRYAFAARTDTGATITGGPGLPFQLNGAPVGVGN